MPKRLAVVSILALSVAGCTGDPTVDNAAMGAAGGAVLGQLIGGNTGATLAGAAVGGIVGGAVGESQKARQRQVYYADPSIRAEIESDLAVCRYEGWC